jgi:hypothetical protein
VTACRINHRRNNVKRSLALFVAVIFVAVFAGLALAQGTTEPGAGKKSDEKKMDKPAGDMKKPTVHNANGTVKSASADSLVVSGKKGKETTEWTFAVDSKTKIKKGGKDVTAADLAPGDNVHVRYREEGGKNVAAAVTVRAGGTAKKAAEESKKDDSMAKKDQKKP